MLPAFMMLAFGAGLPAADGLSGHLLVAVFVLGWAFKRGIADPLLKYGLMPIVVATIGLAIAARNGVRAGYSAEAHPFPSMFADKLFNMAGVTSRLPTSAPDPGAGPGAGHPGLPGTTVTGRAMQAVAQNTESATVLGINVPRMIFYTFAINALLACAAALAGHAHLPGQVRHGRVAGHQGLLRRHHRRLQQQRGALLGGMIVGVCENLAAAYISPAYKDAVALVIFMVVILFKPQGLLGKKRSARYEEASSGHRASCSPPRCWSCRSS
jgi:branched-chain amino acid transport system permease protein